MESPTESPIEVSVRAFVQSEMSVEKETTRGNSKQPCKQQTSGAQSQLLQDLTSQAKKVLSGGLKRKSQAKTRDDLNFLVKDFSE